MRIDQPKLRIVGDAAVASRVAEFRKRAEECFRLARSITPGIDAETLYQFGRDYLDMAETAESLSDPQA